MGQAAQVPQPLEEAFQHTLEMVSAPEGDSPTQRSPGEPRPPFSAGLLCQLCLLPAVPAAAASLRCPFLLLSWLLGARAGAVGLLGSAKGPACPPARLPSSR